jgi:hypothetical protein
VKCAVFGKERAERSDKLVKIAGPVNDTMYLDSLSTNDVEDKIGFDHQNAIAVLSKFRMSRHSPEERMMLKPSNAFIKSINKGNGSAWTVLCDKLQNGKEIFLSSGKISKCSLTGHSSVDGVLSSSVGG